MQCLGTCSAATRPIPGQCIYNGLLFTSLPCWVFMNGNSTITPEVHSVANSDLADSKFLYMLMMMKGNCISKKIWHLFVLFCLVYQCLFVCLFFYTVHSVFTFFFQYFTSCTFKLFSFYLFIYFFRTLIKSSWSNLSEKFTSKF